jgi:TupA-like ATPgrasp
MAANRIHDLKTLLTNRIIMWVRSIRIIRASYVHAHGRSPKIFRPRRFTEKIQWRKLFDRNSLFPVFCDKLATRELIAARIGAEYLAPLYWTGVAEEIPFDTLVPPYFLKTTHASGQVVSVADAAQDFAAIRACAAEWLQICFATANEEPGYKNVSRRLMAEQALLAEDGGPPEERRLFVFDGKVAVINTVFVEDGKVRHGAFHTPGWDNLDWHFTRVVARKFARPKRLADMVRIAEDLGKGIDHIRVDFYDCGDRIFISELTPYSWSGLSPFNPDAADFALGRYWRLQWPGVRAIAALVFRARWPGPPKRPDYPAPDTTTTPPPSAAP